MSTTISLGMVFIYVQPTSVDGMVVCCLILTILPFLVKYYHRLELRRLMAKDLRPT